MTALRIAQTTILVLLLILIGSKSWAQEFYVYGGGTENTTTHDQTFGWGLAYMQGVGEHAMISFTYLNEGHLPDHHRDGYAPQVWLRTNISNRQLSLAAGVGPYLYHDTASDRGQSDSYNTHGLGGIVSLAATWYTESRWLFQVRGNWIGASSRHPRAYARGTKTQESTAPAPCLCRLFLGTPHTS